MPPPRPVDEEQDVYQVTSVAVFNGSVVDAESKTVIFGYNRARTTASVDVWSGTERWAHGETSSTERGVPPQGAWWWEVIAPVQVPVARSCGLTTTINGYHEAWIERNGTTTPPVPKTSSNRDEQPPCECGADSLDMVSHRVAPQGDGARLHATDCEGGGEGGGGGGGGEGGGGGGGGWVTYDVCLFANYWLGDVYLYSEVISCWTETYWEYWNQTAPPVSRTAASGDRLPSVTIAVSDELPQNAAAVAFRVAGNPPRNLVLVRSDAEDGDLAAALAAIRSFRRRHGDAIDRSIRITVPRTVRDFPLGADARREVRLQLGRLRQAAPEHVEGVGRTRAVTIPLATEGSR